MHIFTYLHTHIYIYIYNIFTPSEFSHQLTLMVFNWNLSDSKSPQVSRTLLSILADLNNTVVWTVSPVLLFTNHPVLVSILWWLYQEH